MTPTDAHRKIYNLLANQHRHTGLSREELAARSGLSDRAMRRVIEELRTLAATHDHPSLGRPLVIGFDPELERYVAAQTAEQAQRVLFYYAKRLQPMADALRAQSAAAKHYGISEAKQAELFTVPRRHREHWR